MADPRSIIVLDSSGAPLTSGSPSVQAFDRTTGASRTAPTIAHVAAVPGTWRFTPTDADETTGTVVLVDFGAGNLPRFAAFAVFKADNSNQFWAVPIVGADGTAWSGAAPTFGGYTGGVTPTLTAIAGAATALYVAAPSAGDVSTGAEGRIDGPAGSSQPFWNVSTEPQVSSGPANVTASPGVAPDALVVQAVREYLLRWLPAKVAQLNPLRVATLKSALVGPFTVPVGAALRLSTVSQEATPVTVALTSGVRTSAQVAADITAAAVPGLTASVDEAQRLVLTATATPAAGAPSCVLVRSDSTGANAVFGWADGGEHVEVPALVAPTWRGVVDGLPLTAPDMGQGFWVMLRNRTAKPTHPGIRRDTYNVAVAVEVWRPFSANGPPHRTREAISSCVRAVRELVEAGDGRYLGRQYANDIALATVSDVTIAGDPLTLSDVPGVMFDVARLTLNCRVFQRPD